jgi:threonine/homoserine/homoserine lactone efflux protein
MAGVIGQILPEAIGIALSPFPIIGLILILFTKNARTNSLAFLGGWLAGLVIVGLIIFALVNAGRISVGEESTEAGISWLTLLLGVVLLFLAYRQWQSRPKAGQQAPTPKWMTTLDSIKPGAAAALGAALSGVNPKNLIFNVSAAAAIAAADLDTTSNIIVFIIYIILASISIIGPVVYMFAAGKSAEKVLNELKTWLIQNNSGIMSVLFLILGAKFVGEGLAIF